MIARLETPDAREFDVPGVDGARGIARYAYDELATEVFFLHGSVLARAYIIQQGPTATDGSADHTSEVARIATLWAPLLDAVLGTDGR